MIAKDLDKPSTNESLQKLQPSSEVQNEEINPGGLGRYLGGLTSLVGYLRRRHFFTFVVVKRTLFEEVAQIIHGYGRK